MRSPVKLIFIISLLFSSFFNAHCVGIMAGNFGWHKVGHDSFLISLTLYTDCNNGPMSATVTIKVTSDVFTTRWITWNTYLSDSTSSPVDVTPACSTYQSRCQNSASGFIYGIQKYEYYFLYIIPDTLNADCYQSLEYSACCINSSVTNVSANSTFKVTARIDKCSGPDNSIEFAQDPVFFICSYQWAKINTGGISPDNFPVAFNFNSFPNIKYWGCSGCPYPRGIFIDSDNGIMHFQPIANEVCTFEINVDIGNSTQERVCQAIITSCPSYHPPTVGGSAVYKEVCAGDVVNFSITTDDISSSDTLTVEYEHPITGAVFTVNNGLVKHPAATFNWITSTSDTSRLPYYFKISVKDNGCPVNQKWSQYYRILVKSVIAANHTVVDSGCGKYYFEGVPLTGNNLKYSWNGADAVKNSHQNFYHKYIRPGIYPFTLTITAPNSCPVSYKDTIKAKSFFYIDFPKDTLICQGHSVTLTPHIYNSSGSLKYNWSNGDSINSSITEGPLFAQTKYKVSVTDTLNCSSNDSIDVKTRIEPVVYTGNDTSVCENVKVTRNSLITFDKSSKYLKIKWYSISDTNSISKQSKVTLFDSGHYICLLKDDNNCQASDTFYLKVNTLPIVKAGSDDSTCVRNGTYLLNGLPDSVSGYWTGTGILQDHLKKKWYFDPDYVGITHLSTNPLIYHYYDQNHCYNADTLNIKVYKYFNVTAGKYPVQCVYNMPLQLLGSPPGGFWTPDVAVSVNFFNPSVAGAGKHLISYEYHTFCPYTDTTEIIVVDKPHISMSTYNGDSVFCKGQGLILLNGSPARGLDWGHWSGTGVVDKYFNSAIGSGTYMLHYHFTDLYGCYNEDSFAIRVAEPFVSILNKDKGICMGRAIELHAKSSSKYGLTWYADQGSDGILNYSAYTNSAIYIPGNTDKIKHYFRIFVNTNDSVCSKAYDSINMNIGEYPLADFEAVPNSGSAPLLVQFKDKTSLIGSRISNFYWDFGDSTTSLFKNPFHFYYSSGKYSVKLKVVSEYGCEDSILKNSYIFVTACSIAENQQNLITIDPNPGKYFIMIKLENAENKIVSVELFDTHARSVLKFEGINENSFRLENPGFLHGLYLIKTGLLDKKVITKMILFE